MKKKSIVIAILVLILFNFIYVNSFAEGMDQSQFEAFVNGEAGVTSSSGTPSKSKTEIFGFDTNNAKSTYAKGAGAVAYLFSIPALIGSGVLSLVVNSTGIRNTTSDKFTIQDLLFGSYDIFDINFFKYKTNDVVVGSGTTSGSTDGSETSKVIQVKDTNSVSGKIKTQVAKWYFILRNVSIVLSLVILIYMGIRMALSTVSEEQAKYKKMAIAWLTSLILMFSLHYIFLLIFYISDVLMGFLNNFVPDNVTVEYDMVESVRNKFSQSSGWGMVPNIIMLYMIVYFQMKFFVIYFIRMLEVCFLTIISPLVTITYSIDKVGDNRAQAFSALIKTIVLKTFLQFIHATIYIIFIFSAGAIAQRVPLLAILFFSALSRAEKIIKNTFKVQGKGLRDFKLRRLIGK